MKEKLESIKNDALDEIEKCNDEASLNNVKSKYLGKKSVFSEVMSKMSSLDAEEKKSVGMVSNEVRTAINEVKKSNRSWSPCEKMKARVVAEQFLYVEWKR